MFLAVLDIVWVDVRCAPEILESRERQSGPRPEGPALVLGSRMCSDVPYDLVVFDPEKIRDRATYFETFQYSEGVNFVLVNGSLVVDGGNPMEAKPEKVLAPQRMVSGPRTTQLRRELAFSLFKESAKSPHW